jgi:aldehyde:ferredoxin oxidoreductase
MCQLSTRLENLPPDWSIFGGRALTARILNCEVDPKSDPLGQKAKLVIACGPLAGTTAPSFGRLSIGAKSPLTHGIKESNTGGSVAQSLDRLGIRVIIIEGKPEADKLYLLHLKNGAISLLEAEQYRGLKNYDLVQELFLRFGKSASIISIGLAGERHWKTATVAVTDHEGHPSRHAARGGLGAVMGVKGLKGIVIENGGHSSVKIMDKTSFATAAKSLTDLLQADSDIREKQRYGTSALVSLLSHLGSMPVRNYSGGKLENVENLSGEAIEKLNKQRGGRMSSCMQGCPVHCAIVFKNKKGKQITSGLEYETIAMMGSNLGIVDPDIVARFDYLCDNIGIDSIEIGSALGIAAEHGKMQMGDAKSVESLLTEIEKATAFGSILGNGVMETGKFLGAKRIPAYRGQALPAHDPRATKGTRISYLTSPMGADHTAGLSYEEPAGKKKLLRQSLQSQLLSAIWDAMGYCLLAVPNNKARLLNLMCKLLNARYGLDLSQDDLLSVGKEVLKGELAFNRDSGFHSSKESGSDFFAPQETETQNTVSVEETHKLWDDLDAFQLEL